MQSPEVQGIFGGVYDWVDDQCYHRNPIPFLSGINSHLARYPNSIHVPSCMCLCCSEKKGKVIKYGMTTNIHERVKYNPTGTEIVVVFDMDILCPEHGQQLHKLVLESRQALIDINDRIISLTLTLTLMGGLQRRLALYFVEIAMQFHEQTSNPAFRSECEIFAWDIRGEEMALTASAVQNHVLIKQHLKLTTNSKVKILTTWAPVHQFESLDSYCS